MSVRSAGRRVVLLLALVGLLVAPSLAAAADPVAVIIELQPGSGQIQVRRAGDPVWRSAQPLLSLRPGDQITVGGDGRVALAFRGVRGIRVVTAVDSPFTVEARPARTGGEIVAGVAAGVVDFLLGSRREPERLPIAVRDSPQIRVTILSPRDSRLLPGPIAFEWTGFQSLRYRVRVSGPEGVLWEAVDLPRGQVSYPDGAPPLSPGVRYHWQLEAPETPPQQAYFEMLSAEQAYQIRRELDSVAAGGTSDGSRTGPVVLRAGFLVQQGLYTEARRELAAAIASDPREPTLHYLSGVLYERLGLPGLAAQEFLEARDLIGKRP